MSSWEKKLSIEAAPLHGEQIEGDSRGSGGGGGGIWGLDPRLRGGGGASEAGDRRLGGGGGASQGLTAAHVKA